jgi:negative regulator of sigma F NrsF-like protein
LSDLSFLDEIPDPVEPPSAGRAAAEPRPPRPPRLAPTRSASQRRKLAALAVSAAWLCTHLCVFGVRQDFHELPAGYVAAQVLLPLVFGVCCLAVALAPGKLGLGLGVAVVSGMALLGPLSFWILALSMPAPHPPGQNPSGFWLGSLLCFDITLSWAAAPLLLVALSLRRAFATQAVGRSALVGAALGLLSGGAINLHCPNVDPGHLLAGHAAAVALAALLGAGLVVKSTRA